MFEPNDILLCPITMQVMQVPVILVEDGHTYEKEAIVKWLETNKTSPVTRQPIQSGRLVPNYAILSAIDDYNRQVQQQQQQDQEMQDVQDTQTQHTHPSPEFTIACTPIFTANGRPMVQWNVALKEPAQESPLNLICVLDVSGSMSMPSQDMKHDDEVGSVFSRLDLLKHGMKTVIELLRIQDTLTIVTFSDNASVALKTTIMNEAGKQRARNTINLLKPLDTTNLWGGLQLGMQLAYGQRGRTAIILQTDGEPTSCYMPPRGIAYAMGDACRSYSISTCGYGTSLNSPLLCDIARIGKGTYAYIPDGSMLGTVFIHMVTNLLHSHDFNTNIMCQDGSSVHIPILHHGQTYTCLATSVPVGPHVVNNQTLLPNQCFEVLRQEFVQLMQTLIAMGNNGDYTEALGKLSEFVKSVKAGPYPQTFPKLTEALLCDIEFTSETSKGQIDKAFRYWRTWGMHYLPSVLFAHMRQEKVNFKDVSMEMYSNPILDEAVNRAETIFISLPPPKSSIRQTNKAKAAPLVDMSAYNCKTGGCVSGDTMIALEDEEMVRMDELRKGMVLSNGSIVACLVKFEDVFKCVTSSGVTITKYHPVMLPNNDKWVFPHDVFDGNEVDVKDVYNIVVAGKEQYVVTANGVKCIALGHGIVDDAVAAHPYLGTQRVVDDLKAMPGFQDGLVVYNQPTFKHDEKTGLISGIST